MRVYAVFRIRKHSRFSEWHVYKLFREKKDAQAWVGAKNPNACTYEYAVQSIKVE